MLFASLGAVTSIAGGTLQAANGLTIGTGGTLAGHGNIDARIAATLGSTIEATANLTIGAANAYDGFSSDGVLYANANTVTINDRNVAVLGSLTQLGEGASGGTLTAGTAMVGDTHAHFLLEEGKTLAGRGTINGNFKNQGDVIGDGTGAGERLVFSSDWTVSGNGTFENVEVQGVFAPGNSPAIVEATNALFTGAVEFELGGTDPGFLDNNHDQINDVGFLSLGEDSILRVLPWDGFLPGAGDEFEIMTWQDSLTGVFSDLWVDPWFTEQGIGFDLYYDNPTGAGSLTLQANTVPEPSSLILCCLGAVGMGLVARRRRKIAG